jgi:hypothetical protein
MQIPTGWGNHFNSYKAKHCPILENYRFIYVSPVYMSSTQFQVWRQRPGFAEVQSSKSVCSFWGRKIHRVPNSSFTCFVSIFEGSILSCICLLPGRTSFELIIHFPFYFILFQFWNIIHKQVNLDFGLAIPKFSVQLITSSLKELLELAPVKKVNDMSSV